MDFAYLQNTKISLQQQIVRIQNYFMRKKNERCLLARHHKSLQAMKEVMEIIQIIYALHTVKLRYDKPYVFVNFISFIENFLNFKKLVLHSKLLLTSRLHCFRERKIINNEFAQVLINRAIKQYWVHKIKCKLVSSTRICDMRLYSYVVSLCSTNSYASVYEWAA